LHAASCRLVEAEKALDVVSVRARDEPSEQTNTAYQAAVEVYSRAAIAYTFAYVDAYGHKP
jgi:hypothetical protein